MGAGPGAIQRTYLHPCLHIDLALHQRRNRRIHAPLTLIFSIVPQGQAWGWRRTATGSTSDWVDLRTPCCVGVDQQETRVGKTSRVFHRAPNGIHPKSAKNFLFTMLTTHHFAK